MPTIKFRRTADQVAERKHALWLALYHEAVRYWTEHGDCIFRGNPDLTAWANETRSKWKNERLDAEQIKLLKKINFPRHVDRGATRARPREDVEELAILQERIKTGTATVNEKLAATQLTIRLHGQYMRGGLGRVHAKRLGFE
jgi:hypothetical protein